jgi:hypothetical protein
LVICKHCEVFVVCSIVNASRCRFYFPALLVGPAFEFVSYRALIDESIFTSPTNSQVNGVRSSEKVDGSPSFGTQRRVPTGRKRVAYMKFLQGLGYLLVFTMFGPKFNYDVTVDPHWAVKPLWFRLVADLPTRRFADILDKSGNHSTDRTRDSNKVLWSVVINRGM